MPEMRELVVCTAPEVDVAGVCAQPHVLVNIFVNRPDRIAAQALGINIALRIILKYVFSWRQYTEPTVFGAYPQIAFGIFINSYNIIVAKAAGISSMFISCKRVSCTVKAV